MSRACARVGGSAGVVSSGVKTKEQITPELRNSETSVDMRVEPAALKGADSGASGACSTQQAQEAQSEGELEGSAPAAMAREIPAGLSPSESNIRNVTMNFTATSLVDYFPPFFSAFSIFFVNFAGSFLKSLRQDLQQSFTSRPSWVNT